MTSPLTNMAEFITLMNRARESQAQRGQAAIDLVDLLIACTQDGGNTGHTLRSRGFTAESLTEGTRSVESGLLDTLGINLNLSHPARALSQDYVLTAQAQQIVQNFRSTQLLALDCLSESSGTVTALAQVLNLDIAETQEELRTLPLHQPQHRSSQGDLSAHTSVFLEAPISVVWGIIRDPLSLPRWVPAISQVNPQPLDGTWQAQTTSPEPSMGKVDQNKLAQEVRVLTYDSATHRLSYEVQYPLWPNANTQEISVALSETSGGTLAELTLSFHHSKSNKKPLLTRALAPLARPFSAYSAKIQVMNMADALRTASTS